MDPLRQRRFSDINSDSPPAQCKPSRASRNRRTQEYQLNQSETLENMPQRKQRHSSLHVSKGSVGGVHADPRDMPQSFSSPEGQPRTPTRTCSTPHYVNPSSSLLQGLIKEQRVARSSRPPPLSRRGSHGQTTELPVNTSDNASVSEKNRQTNDALPTGVKEPKEMGIREMNQYVGKITKEVFDLKLEIVHREKQTIAMKTKLEQMAKLEELVEELEATETDLRETNAMLQKDIEKRDQGLQEAVALICDLEAKIEAMESGNDEAWSNQGDGMLSTESLEKIQTPITKRMIEVPDRSSSRKGTTAKARHSRILPARHAKRQPSFLLDENESTSVLRSLYAMDANGSRALSLFSGQESEELNSPRLSALSECSDLNTSLDPIELSKPEPSARSDPIKSSGAEKMTLEAYNGNRFTHIEEWIPHTPSLPYPQEQGPTRNAFRNAQIMCRKQPTLGAAFEARRTRSAHPERSRNTAMFAGRLPPTPDTMSTSFKDHSIVEERSQYGRNHVFTSTTSVDSMGRPASAENVTTRPSTAGTAMFDGPDFGGNRTASMPPSYTRYASEPPQGNGAYFNEEEVEVPNRHPLWDEQNRVLSQGRSSYTRSVRSRMSDSALSDLYGNGNASRSTMLSPLDWLEAAGPRPDDTRDRPKNPWASRIPDENAEEEEEDFQPPAIPTARARHIRMTSLNQKTSSVRKGFRDRFFGRSKTNNNALASSSSAKDIPVSPRSLTTAPSTARRRSMKLDSNHGTGRTSRQSESRALSAYSAPDNDPSMKRPRTYNSIENIKHEHEHRRRGSLSLLGWLKGSNNNNNNSNNNNNKQDSVHPPSISSPPSAGTQDTSASGCAIQPFQRSTSAWGFSMRPGSRQSSRLNPNFGGGAGGNSSSESIDGVDGGGGGGGGMQQRSRHPLAEEVRRSGS